MDRDNMIRSARAVVFGAAHVLLALGAQLSSSAHVSAQWLPDRAYTEGPGFRVGDLELHPGVAARAGYDTNVFRQPGTAAFPEKGAAMLGITPHLHVSTLQRQRRSQGEDAAGEGATPPPPVTFDLGVAATYFQYFKLKSVPKNVDLDFDGSLSILPERTFGLDVGASYERSARPFTARLNGESNIRYAVDRVRPALTLRGQSKGGVLQGRIGFAPFLTIYEGDAFKYLDQNQYGVPASLAWKFLPNTALVFDAVYGFSDYTHPNRGSTPSVFLSDSHRFQSRLGLNGAITPRFAVRAMAGYAVVFQKESALDDREDAVAEAALTYGWTPSDNFELGYQRTLEVSALSGWTQLDRGYAKLGTLIAGRLMLKLEAGVAHVNYGRLLAPDAVTGSRPLGTDNDTSRDDIRIDGGVHAEVRATNWLAFLADFNALVNITDFEYDRPGSPVPYPGDFKAFQVFGGVRAHY